MKQSEKPNTKRRATGIKSNFHDYVERTKMKDFVVAVVADIQCGECAEDVDSIYQHLYDEYDFPKDDRRVEELIDFIAQSDSWSSNADFEVGYLKGLETALRIVMR